MGEAESVAGTQVLYHGVRCERVDNVLLRRSGDT